MRGSHHKFKKDNKSIIVPLHKPIKEVYVKQILKRFKGLKMNLILENVSDDLAKAIKAMAKIRKEQGKCFK
ncbi:type II toxin-antitoxin system HicA family toxin [Campylobacter jejuni]|nr:type II toxin-antitoxin system HicA family toxin [Campylobacter jejuni]